MLNCLGYALCTFGMANEEAFQTGGRGCSLARPTANIPSRLLVSSLLSIVRC